MEKGRPRTVPHLLRSEHNLNPTKMNAKICFGFKRATCTSSEAAGGHLYKLLYVLTNVH